MSEATIIRWATTIQASIQSVGEKRNNNQHVRREKTTTNDKGKESCTANRRRRKNKNNNKSKSKNENESNNKISTGVNAQ